MTDHLSKAKQAIAAKNEELQNLQLVIQTVGDELASAAWGAWGHAGPWHKHELGRLLYERQMADVPALMGQFQLAPLEYRKRRPWAANIEPASLPLPDDLEQRQAATPFYIKAMCVEHQVSANLNWYIQSCVPNKLIHVQVKLLDAAQWIKFYADPVRNGREVVGWRERIETKLHYAGQVRAGGTRGGYSNPTFSMLTIWWDEGITLEEVIQE